MCRLVSIDSQFRDMHSQPVYPQLTYVTYLSKLEVSQLLEMMQVS